jgi:hypothetical protein
MANVLDIQSGESAGLHGKHYMMHRRAVGQADNWQQQQQAVYEWW